MFDIISKDDYWSYMDQELIYPSERRLKVVQDGYVLDRLADVTGARILEIGGGQSRVLQKFRRMKNECWNADDFGGGGNGPQKRPRWPKYKIVPTLLGEFSSELPDNYFDYVFSISVVEHVPGSELTAMFADSCRVLKPGGVMFHAIDVYLYDDHELPHAASQVTRIQMYLDLVDKLPLAWRQDPAIDATVTFRSRYASNPDAQLYNWSLALPELRPMRAAAQNVSIKAEWTRTDEPFDWSSYTTDG